MRVHVSVSCVEAGRDIVGSIVVYEWRAMVAPRVTASDNAVVTGAVAGSRMNPTLSSTGRRQTNVTVSRIPEICTV